MERTTSNILQTELAFCAQTQKASKIVNKDHFRVNSITYEEMLQNMKILLNDEKHCSTITIANLLPTADVMKSLSVRAGYLY